MRVDRHRTPPRAVHLVVTPKASSRPQCGLAGWAAAPQLVASVLEATRRVVAELRLEPVGFSLVMTGIAESARATGAWLL